VPVRDHTELIAWQLANELRMLIVEFTSKPPACRDFKFSGQVRDSISSVCRNLSEGFYRYHHKEFAHFVSIARGSLGETQDALQDAHQRSYLSPPDFERMWTLSKRCTAALNALHRHLRGTNAP
jgi:four helix bundle protein